MRAIIVKVRRVKADSRPTGQRGRETDDAAIEASIARVPASTGATTA